MIVEIGSPQAKHEKGSPMDIPKIVPVSNLPDEAKKAAYELIAQLLREQTPVLTINLADVAYEEKPIGNYEISVRRID